MVLTAMHRTDLIQQLWQAALLLHPALWHAKICSSAFVQSMCLSQTCWCKKVEVAAVRPEMRCAWRIWLQSPSINIDLLTLHLCRREEMVTSQTLPVGQLKNLCRLLCRGALQTM